MKTIELNGLILLAVPTDIFSCKGCHMLRSIFDNIDHKSEMLKLCDVVHCQDSIYKIVGATELEAWG